MTETTREELDRLHAESKKTGDYISLAIAMDKHWPAMSARLATLEAAELKAIDERDEWSDLFDKVCVYLGVETEYSNVRSPDDVLVDCGERIGELLAHEAERDALAATVERLRKYLKDILTDMPPKIDDRLRYREFQFSDNELAEIEALVAATPAQSLAKVRAEALRGLKAYRQGVGYGEQAYVMWERIECEADRILKEAGNEGT